MSAPDDTDRLAFLGQLAAGLAHEIRTPLSTLQANLQLLQEDWQDDTSEKSNPSKERIKLLLKETARLEEILNDFLRYAGRHKLDRRSSDLNRVVGEVLDFVTPEATQKKVRVMRAFGELPRVSVDVNLFKQALLNLVMNAIQAMPGGGELMVRTQKWKEYAQVDMTDTGKGMTPDVQARIWDVYYSTKKAGTGLGLPTARRLINEHGGTITVTSEAGKGSCFTIRLPLDAEARGGGAAIPMADGGR